MMHRRSARRAALAGALLALTLPVAAFAQPHQGGTIVYANLSGPGTLDPYVSSSMVELEVINEIYEGLVAIDAQYQTKPMLADHVDTSADARSFTFALRQGVRFHNGKQMTSADVLASFERYRRISANAAALSDVASFEAPDPYTFIIRLNHPNAVFLDVLKSPVYPFVIMPAEEKDKPPRMADAIGTGPFMLGEWIKDSHLVLRRFDGYVPNETEAGPDGLAGRRTAYLDSVRITFMPEANARVAALQSGGADVIADVPAELSKRLETRKDLHVQKVFPYCQAYFIVNTQQAPTDDAAVRQAIAAAVGVDDIRDATGQITQRNASMVYPSSPYYAGDLAKPYYDQNNPAKAKELLAQAGHPGARIKLLTNSNYPAMRDSILVLAEQLKAAGFDADVQVVDWTTNAADMQEGKGGWNVSTTSFCSNPLLGPQQWKFMIYGFPHVKGDGVLDAAYARFYGSLDLEARKQAWATIERDVLSQAYMIKIADQGNVRAYDDKLVGFEPYYMIHFWNVSVK